MHYCIGDVHGCYDEMIAMLDKIESTDPDAQLIFLGDFVDRGPKVWESLTWAMEHITPDGKYQSVQGNHEQMVVQWYMQYCEWKKKTFHFGGPPRPNYDFMDQAKKANMLDPTSLKPIMDFFISLPFHKVVEVPAKDGGTLTYDIVHAWYDYDEPEDSAQQYLDNIWRREADGNHLSGNVIIHGHTPTITFLYNGMENAAPGRIVYRKNAINIDGGCVFSGQIDGIMGHLCGLCLETLEEFYVEGAGRTASSLVSRLISENEEEDHDPGADPFRNEILARLAL